MIFLFSSAGHETYKQFILQLLCYPTDYILTNVSYSLDLVQEKFCYDPKQLVERSALIIFVDYDAVGEGIQPVFFPLRRSHITKAAPFGGKLLLDLKLGKFIYYDDLVQRAYKSDIQVELRRRWNTLIKQEQSAPQAVPRPPCTTIDPKTPASWKSSGKFVIEVDDGIIDVDNDPQKEKEIAERCDDWKSVIDMIAPRKQLADKLFYQIKLTKPGASETLPITNINGGTVFQLTSGDYVDLVVHFYQGKEKRMGAKKMLATTVDSGFISTIGRTSIDVYPDQHSGKVEKILLIVKKQLSKDVTRVIIREDVTDESSLANVELYLLVEPRMSLIAYILILFFVGSLLNALPPDPKWLWFLRVIGAALMAISFWLAFAKFPSKS
jgi:hypothetical protein